ncbi:hypothetical protein NQ314_006930 [Rhamnusium bicolor]|uniref:Adenylate kinase 8 n=1 Tax=Rhamnusium bicolor TaxID=1586634 RepID=A0AAV8YWF9_9CUCU|nr:hypothetical protein NQ314_006930 [Rhamnusium bicolor]
MSDPTRRPLNFPSWHIPYLEKHRIYELLHEVARELVIQKPIDHVLFTKQILQNAAKTRDVARVLFLKSNRINCMEVAAEIAKVTKQVIISDVTLRRCLGKDIDDCPPAMIAKCLAYLIRTDNAYNVGWIMVECIRTEAEAKELLQHGILPTHVFHLIAPLARIQKKYIKCTKRIQKYIKEIHLGKRNVPEIVFECIELSKIRKASKPVRPRVIIIGPRGSGRKTQAKLLAENLDIVHVDFEHLICQAWMAESDLGEKLRSCRKEVCFHSELLSQVINKRILEEDCLQKGWVLTGYPYTDSDFKYLDNLDTPPNRVVFFGM